MRLPFKCSRVNYISPTGFIVWEFPTVYIAQKLRLGKYLGELIYILDVDKIRTTSGVNIIIWGVVLLCHALANSFQAFFALRFILGA
jgi:hypothetical protein